MTTNPESPLGRLNRAFSNRAMGNDVDDNIEALYALTALRSDLDRLEDDLALMARRNGASFARIADALDITRQRAHQRWGNISRFAGWDTE